MIRARCPNCNAKVKAPDALAGKKGRCPECKGVVPLPSADTAAASPAISFSVAENEPAPDIKQDTAPAETVGLDFNPPENLRRNCHYLICNSKEVIARWDDDGKGWMVHVKDGFVKAQNNTQQLPTMGNYIFIEIEIVSEGPHQRLAGVNIFTLPGAFALTKLAKHESAILEALEQTTTLNDRQRALVKQRVNAKYLPSIWDDAAEF
jgi:hypothetical protein